MKLLNILKAITTYVYIMSVIAFPIATIISVIFMFNSEIYDLPVIISGNLTEYSKIWSKIAILISLANFGLFVYALFHFKKLLANFKEKLIFETETCQLFYKIAKTIILYALLLFIIGFIPKTTQTASISVTFGFSPSLFIGALGLFFAVLAEVFKMGKQLKEENELTI